MIRSRATDPLRFRKSEKMADGKKQTVGPVAIVVGADPSIRMVILQFNQPVNRLEFTPEGALELAKQLGTRAAIAAGVTPPEPIQVENGKGKAN